MTTPGVRLARAILAYLVLMIAIVTLAPFRFALVPVQGLSTVWGLQDMVLNVVLFLPLGFVHQLARPRGASTDWRRALALGAILSAAIEGAQFFAPGRYPSLVDLATNAMGAALGTWIAARAVLRLDGAETVRAFALDLPLMGLAYLFVPLLWLVGLSAESGAAMLLVLPMVSVAWIMASVHVAYTAPGARAIVQLASASALFVAVGLLPALRSAPRAVVWAAVAFVAVTLLRLVVPEAWTRDRTIDGRPSRRFEAPTLRVALLPLIVFILAFALWPLDAPFTAFASWRGAFAILPPGVKPDYQSILPALAYVSAFTVLGYALAEYRGRTVERLHGIAPRAILWALALSLPLEYVRGWRAGTEASASMLLFTVGAALLGAWFYLLQLRNVQALLGRGPADVRRSSDRK